MSFNVHRLRKLFWAGMFVPEWAFSEIGPFFKQIPKHHSLAHEVVLFTFEIFLDNIQIIDKFYNSS